MIKWDVTILKLSLNCSYFRIGKAYEIILPQNDKMPLQKKKPCCNEQGFFRRLIINVLFVNITEIFNMILLTDRREPGKAKVC